MNGNAKTAVHPWPALEERGIPMEQFLLSCDVVVQCFGAMGKVLTPVKKDVEGNVTKLRKVYNTNPDKYEYLEEMIKNERHVKGSNAVDALLWLKRALTFIHKMLESVVRDVGLSGMDHADPDIKSNYLNSYEETLKKYHNWAIQNAFIVAIKSGLLPGCRAVLLALPYCKDLPETASTTDLAAAIRPFLDGLKTNLVAVIEFYHKEGLDSVASL